MALNRFWTSATRAPPYVPSKACPSGYVMAEAIAASDLFQLVTGKAPQTLQAQAVSLCNGPVVERRDLATHKHCDDRWDHFDLPRLDRWDNWGGDNMWTTRAAGTIGLLGLQTPQRTTAGTETARTARTCQDWEWWDSKDFRNYMGPLAPCPPIPAPILASPTRNPSLKLTC